MAKSCANDSRVNAEDKTADGNDQCNNNDIVSHDLRFLRLLKRDDFQALEGIAVLK